MYLYCSVLQAATSSCPWKLYWVQQMPEPATRAAQFSTNGIIVVLRVLRKHNLSSWFLKSYDPGDVFGTWKITLRWILKHFRPVLESKSRCDALAMLCELKSGEAKLVAAISFRWDICSSQTNLNYQAGCPAASQVKWCWLRRKS